MNVRSNGKMTENDSENDQNGAKIYKNWAQEMARKLPWSCETKVENSDTYLAIQFKRPCEILTCNLDYLLQS